MISRFREAVHKAQNHFHQSAPYRIYDALSGLRRRRANIPDRLLDAYRLEAGGISPHLLTVFLEIKLSGRISSDNVRQLNHHGITLPHQDPDPSPPLGLLQYIPSSYTPYTSDHPGDHL